MKRSLARADAVGVARGAREDRLVHGRHRRVPGRLHLIEPLEEFQRIEAGRADHRRAGGKRGEHRRDQAVDVEQRHDVEAAVRSASAAASRGCCRRGREVGLRQRHDLWARRRAGGVQHERDVVGNRSEPGTPRLADRLAHDAESSRPARRRLSRCRASGRRAARPPLPPPIAVRVDEQRLGPEVGEVELELLGPVGGVERRGRGARSRSTRRRPPSPARWAGRWRRGRCGRCRARSAGRRYRSPDPAARRK